jgi:hypothetical protein
VRLRPVPPLHPAEIPAGAALPDLAQRAYERIGERVVVTDVGDVCFVDVGDVGFTVVDDGSQNKPIHLGRASRSHVRTGSGVVVIEHRHTLSNPVRTP